MKRSVDVLKNWFRTGAKPTAQQFADLIDSFNHKDHGMVVSKHEVKPNGDVLLSFSNGSVITLEKYVLPNQMPLNFIQGLVETLSNKVSKIQGKQLSEENFTSVLKEKLENLEKYTHPEKHEISEVNGLSDALENKVEKEEGKQLSEENFSTQEKEKLEGLENYQEPSSKPISFIENLEDTLNEQNSKINGKVSQEAGKGLSEENFTSEHKEKLVNIDIPQLQKYAKDLEYKEVLESRNLKETDKGCVLYIKNAGVVLTLTEDLSEKFNCYFTAKDKFNGRIEIGDLEVDSPNGLEITSNITRSLGRLQSGEFIIRP